MAHGKWYGCLLMTVCLFAMIESLQSNNPPRRIEKRQVNRLEGPDDSLNFVGTNATFTCVSPLRSCLNMTWYIEDRTSSTGFVPISQYDASVTARILVENTTSGCKLTFMNLRSYDDGKFYCQLYAGRNSIRGREAKLTTTTQRYALRGMSDNSSIVGENVEFICISPLRHCIGISWYKYLRPRDSAIIYSAQEGNFLGHKYLLENSTLGCRLTIRNLDLTDNGGYICKIVISQRPVERSANLYVFVPLNRPENLMSFFGTNTTFSCASPFRSCVNMTWQKEVNVWSFTYFVGIRTFDSAFRDRWIVENTTVGCQLTITYAQLEDSGRFMCELEFRGKRFKGSIVNLAVTSQEDPLRGPSDGMHIAGRWLALTCISPFGDCRGMSWYNELPQRDRVAIYSEENGIYLSDKYIVVNSTIEGCRLTIKNLQRNDTGSVYCQIQVSRRTFEKSATLIVFQNEIKNPLKGPDDDTLSFIDATAAIACWSPLQSCAKINWYKHTPTSHTQHVLVAVNDPQSPLRDRYVLDNSTRLCKLIIRNVRLNDAGYYTCKIVLGSTSFQGKNALLTVINTPEPSVHENALALSDNFSTPGSDVSFTCVSPARSCTGINWYSSGAPRYHFPIYKDGNVVDNRIKYIVQGSATGCELIIRGVERGDFADVFCDIMISQRFYQVIAFHVVFETKSQKLSLSFVGANATFTCDSPLGDCENMTWYIDDLPSIFGRLEFVPIYDVDSTVRDRWAVQKTSSGCKLTLINVQLTDAGHVYCEIMLGGRPIRGETTNFTVINVNDLETIG